jgi:predicted TIM-barrel fold metal-dependent hydrolase
VSDVQVHLWEAESPHKPWPPFSRKPHKPNGFLIDEMLAEMNTAGVDRAVIVPPTWTGGSNDYALGIEVQYPEKFAVVGRFNAKAPDALAQLDNWLKQPHMLGVRMSFHVKPYSDWLDDGSLSWFWAKCERLGIPVMALVPGMVRKLKPVVEKHPGLKLLIPHMACVLDAHGAQAFRDLDDLSALAKHPNVVVNVSSAPCFSIEPYPYRDLYGFMALFGESTMPMGRAACCAALT